MELESFFPKFNYNYFCFNLRNTQKLNLGKKSQIYYSYHNKSNFYKSLYFTVISENNEVYKSKLFNISWITKRDLKFIVENFKLLQDEEED